jgi:multidrug resistance efflux pump
MSDEIQSPAPTNQPTGTKSWLKLPVIFATKKGRLRTTLFVLGGLIIVFVIIPRIFHALHTVSTDDAYVNSYVTFVA